MPQSPEAKKYQETRRGRGTGVNTSGRFERYGAEEADDYLNALHDDNPDGVQVETQIFADATRSIVSTNDSPDVGMEATLNPYRGCEHGCIYCFARPTHEYLGLSAGLDFESKIFVKHEAAKLLAEKLSSKSWEPKILTLSGVTDCYQPLEKKFKITRACLEVLDNFRNPAAIITKSVLVTRDIDVLSSMAAWNGILVNMSVTSLDSKVSCLMEPRAAQPLQRLRAIELLAKAGIPVSVIIGPVVPGLTDHEIPAILKAASDAGATGAHYTILRLPYGVKDLFVSWLENHFPDRASRVISHVRNTRGGKLNDSTFGTRMRGEGVYAENIAGIFALYKRKYNLNRRFHSLATNHFRRDAASGQMSLF